jgi:hypothetical protein
MVSLCLLRLERVVPVSLLFWTGLRVTSCAYRCSLTEEKAARTTRIDDERRCLFAATIRPATWLPRCLTPLMRVFCSASGCDQFYPGDWRKHTGENRSAGTRYALTATVERQQTSYRAVLTIGLSRS